MASASAAGPPLIWNARTGQRLAALGGIVRPKGKLTAYSNGNNNSEPVLFWSSDARELWVGGENGIKIWSRAGELLREISLVKNIVSMARCPRGQRVILGTGKGEIALLQTKDEKILWRKTINAPRYAGNKPNGTIGVAFLPSDRVISWLNYGQNTDKIWVWDARGGFTTQILDTLLGTRRVAVSRDGMRIAAVGNGGISLWESAL